jgi:hypothetical protein
LSPKFTNGGSQDDLINGGSGGGEGNSKNAIDLEGSYLLTELESNTSRTVSPNTSSLHTHTGLRQGSSKRRSLKNQLLKDNEAKLRA